MPVKGEEMFVAGSFMITFSQLKSNKPNLVSEKIKDETYYRKWDMKNKLISHLALLCRSTGVLGVEFWEHLLSIFQHASLQASKVSKLLALPSQPPYMNSRQLYVYLS